MTNQTTIKCPNCQIEIDINEVLYHQLENKYKSEHLAEKKKLEAEIGKVFEYGAINKIQNFNKNEFEKFICEERNTIEDFDNFFLQVDKIKEYFKEVK